MPNWDEVLKEIASSTPAGQQSPFDIVRRKYLKKLSEKTGRTTIAYYSGFLHNPRVFGADIIDDDKNGFMLCCHNIDRACGLDLILHTPGGNLYATDSIIHYLREMFGSDIRVIVPQIAMSAGTMIATSAKCIVMGKHSNLGPVDPQINGFPAFAIKKQFEQAYKEIKADPRVAPIWQPMLAQLGVSFVKQCDWAIDFAKNFVGRSLASNMLNGDPDVSEKSSKIADTLSDLGKNTSHDRRFFYQDCIDMGLVIEMLEDDEDLQDLVLTVHHCFMHVLSNAPVIKIIENHAGKAMIRSVNQ
ncbi:MAG: S49 family peptidase [Pseudomonadota bacterium]